MGPALPAAILGLAALAYWKRHHLSGMTAERKIILQTALSKVRNPADLRKLADAFDSVGQKDAATILRKRAALRELPPDVKEGRRLAFKRGMNSNDPDAVDKLAAAFESQGATGAAGSLRKYAASLRAGAAAPHPAETAAATIATKVPVGTPTAAPDHVEAAVSPVK